MPLAQALARENRVVVVEPLGYGWSDTTKEARTVENTVEEPVSYTHLDVYKRQWPPMSCSIPTGKSLISPWITAISRTMRSG